ncbi:MAG: bifunctional biotin--[acetyl-CoA-carboxylase] ligase/biotin operon repressor BirA [Ectothiorhodospiraceae bacterium]|nr:bifunctional biotin--[acetyl-CoA-carboxylase] ligase/biotin operon repressor BirA [Ectothiorhodospiraceae bacterium]
MSTQASLLQLLADGAPHSGESLGQRLGISRAAVWKHIKALRDAGLEIDGASGAGYRLRHPIRLLDEAEIKAATGQAIGQYAGLRVEYQVDSTNRLALEASPPLPVAVLAEQQTAGRGRRGRPWMSPLGGALYLSVAWPFEAPARGLSGLSLVAGLALADAIEEACVLNTRLKWPNDVQAQGRKLAGILIELVGDPAGQCRAVLGLGVNCALPESVAEGIDQPWTDLYRETGAVPDRNRLAGALLRNLAAVLPVFERDGFAAFQQQWDQRDALRGQDVVLALGERSLEGKALGVDADGALRLQTPDGEHRYVAGEVSVRLRS